LVFDEHGSGAPLVLVHGTGAQARTWGGAVSDLAAGGYRIIAYDRRGCGRSVHRPVRDYRIHVADLAAVIEHVGAPAHLLGWSSGGNTALALAVQRPDLCRCVVVIEPSWHGLRHATFDLAAMVGRVKLDQVRGRPREAAARFYRWVSGFREGGNGFDALPAAQRDVLLDNTPAALADLDPHPFGLLMEHIPTAKLATIPAPITWLLGTQTRSEWFRRCHASAVRVAPGIRTERIAGAGHLLPCEAPEKFAVTVLHAVGATRL
jgi:pimeloyl-ACP methyl ester carboxylesterase